MTDSHLRELERRFKESGSVEDEAAWLLERLRVEELTQERLDLAAYCGHEAAQVVLEKRSLEPSPTGAGRRFLNRALAVVGMGESPASTRTARALKPWFRGLERWGPEAYVRAALPLPWAEFRFARSLAPHLREIAPGYELESYQREIELVESCLVERTSLKDLLREICFLPHVRHDCPEFLVSMALVWAHLPHPVPITGPRPGLAGAGFTPPANAVECALAQVLTATAKWPVHGARSFSQQRLPPAQCRALIDSELVPWALGYSDPVRDRVQARENAAE